MNHLPIGKLHPQLLEILLNKIPQNDNQVILGPGTGLDCSVIDFGDQYLVIKTDPISLTSQNIGRYAVEINVNDIVTTGAKPQWMLTTLILPENETTFKDLEKITEQLIEYTSKYGITIIGGHTEITTGCTRPILSATLIGTVAKNKLISPADVQIGDKIFLTKEIAIETISILSNDFSLQLEQVLTKEELKEAQNYINNPGISVFKDATLIKEGFGITAMHDPTEGGIASALWELSIASNKTLIIDPEKIPTSNLTKKICNYFSMNPINSISSGALLFSANPDRSKDIIKEFKDHNLPVSEIGIVQGDGFGVYLNTLPNQVALPRPERDEITKIFQS